MSLLAYLTPKSNKISSDPPGIAKPLTSLYILSTFPPWPPLVYPSPPNIWTASLAQNSTTSVEWALANAMAPERTESSYY